MKKIKISKRTVNFVDKLINIAFLFGILVISPIIAIYSLFTTKNELIMFYSVIALGIVLFFWFGFLHALCEDIFEVVEES